MNTVIRTLATTASVFLLITGHTALADSIGELDISPVGEDSSAPAIRLVSASNSDPVVATVSYTARNFESEEGMRDLYKLLARASKQVCSGETLQHRRPAIMKSSQVICYRKTLASTVSQFDNENLSRIHEGKSLISEAQSPKGVRESVPTP